MATALETTAKPQTTATTPVKLVAASLIGAIYVLASLAIVLVAIPLVWQAKVAPSFGVGYTGLEMILRLGLQIAVAAGLTVVGRAAAGANPPKGIRGGIFLMISAAITIFFIVRAVGLNLAPSASAIGMLGVGGVLLVLAFRLLTGSKGEKWMRGLEEQGWFVGTPYKKALGHRVRRLTILGILLVGGTGVYALYFQRTIPENWTLAMPYMDQPITVLTEARYVVPVVLLALTLWVAYRIVNMPTFAEFLIATEAEMNKVSWSTRKGLFQDTIVVLVTTLGMTLFLLVVDLFWGWLLSTSWVGVLPPKATEVQKDKQSLEAKW